MNNLAICGYEIDAKEELDDNTILIRYSQSIYNESKYSMCTYLYVYYGIDESYGFHFFLLLSVFHFFLLLSVFHFFLLLSVFHILIFTEIGCVSVTGQRF